MRQKNPVPASSQVQPQQITVTYSEQMRGLPAALTQMVRLVRDFRSHVQQAIASLHTP